MMQVKLKNRNGIIDQTCVDHINMWCFWNLYLYCPMKLSKSLSIFLKITPTKFSKNFYLLTFFANQIL
jgi:hypothetical protein